MALSYNSIIIKQNNKKWEKGFSVLFFAACLKRQGAIQKDSVGHLRLAGLALASLGLNKIMARLC